MVWLWVCFAAFVVGLANKIPGLSALAVIAAAIILYRRHLSASETKAPLIRPLSSAAATRPSAPSSANVTQPLISMPNHEPFTCKSCGAANTGHAAVAACEFCGAPPPAKKAPPPPPMSGPAVTVAVEDSIGVSSGGYVCRSCLTYVSVPEREMPGSTGLEVLLWFFYIIPGVFYSMWRRNQDNWRHVCRTCSSNNMTPVSSPEGRSMFTRKYGRRPRFD